MHETELLERSKQIASDASLSESERAYHGRILRVLGMPDLSKQEGNPVNMIASSVVGAPFFADFDIANNVPQIVSEWETFDLFNFPENHVARRPSDSYFLKKSDVKRESILLRPHTSVMWYYHLIEGLGKQKLLEE